MRRVGHPRGRRGALPETREPLVRRRAPARPPQAARRRPLVVAFHGGSQSGGTFANYTGLSHFANAHGFAVLYPTAAIKVLGDPHYWYEGSNERVWRFLRGLGLHGDA